MTGRIILGDCLQPETWASIPDQSVHCCVTSPPYFGLRDYGSDGQLGLEPTPQEYIANMVTVFRHVRRVLRDDGTLWLNLGDSYASGGRGTSDAHKDKMGGATAAAQAMGRKVPPEGLKQKDLIGIPWRVALALQADGWYLRQDIIWHKPNPMPESVRDRCTKAHEYLFLLTKKPRYYYDAEAIKEPCSKTGTEGHLKGGKGKRAGTREGLRGKAYGRIRDFEQEGRQVGHHGEAFPASGRNKRSVWTIPTQPYPGAHFAVFPPKLIEPCILAGTSAKGVCPECGGPWERVVEREGQPPSVDARERRCPEHIGNEERTRKVGGQYQKWLNENPNRTTGWQPTCSCEHIHEGNRTGQPWTPTLPATVIDPFFGAGTTGVVALAHGRDYLGIELNPEYATQAQDRIDLHEDPAGWVAQDMPDEAPLFGVVE